ncbi:MAG: DNA-directed RNA polymerase sigma-70 factor [Pirellulaceae bacterium]|nr:MAG: DNA-directed RNA polymerase sigma-70 factor [Pirellulaceae bacterium]
MKSKVEGALQASTVHTELELAELIDRHQVMVWRYLRALGADAALADDLTQDTFLEVIRKPLTQYSDSATASYLRRVAHNLFISRRRREARMTVTDNAEAFEDAWMRWAGFDGGNAAMDALEECFGRLTERAQLALRLRFAEEASRSSIADALGISEHGAKNLMQRAKAQLRDCVKQKIS